MHINLIYAFQKPHSSLTNGHIDFELSAQYACAMERLPQGQAGKKRTAQERLAIKSLPLLSILVDSPQAVSDIQNGHVARAVAGSLFAAGIGFAGSHLILNDGPKPKETWQDVKNWSREKAGVARRLFPSKKRTIIAGAAATLGILAMGDGAVQTVQGDFPEAMNAAATGATLEGVAGLNLIQPHLRKRREYELSILGGAVSRQKDLVEQLGEVISERGEIIASAVESFPVEEQGLELQASQTVFLAPPEVHQ